MRSMLAFHALLALSVAACGGSPLPSGTSDTSLASRSATAEAGSVSANPAGGRARTSGVVYVTSQGLYFDTFVAVDPLPMQGRFQLLENGTTEFGPGDPGYLGGRWWEDLNQNGMQDEGDHFFLCPLLPPGRPTP